MSETTPAPSPTGGGPPLPPDDMSKNFDGLANGIGSSHQSEKVSTSEKSHKDVLQQLKLQFLGADAWLKNAKAFRDRVKDELGLEYDTAKKGLEPIFEPVKEKEQALPGKKKTAMDTKKAQDIADKVEKDSKEAIEANVKKLKEIGDAIKPIQERVKQLTEVLFSETENSKKAEQAVALSYALEDLERAIAFDNVTTLSNELKGKITDYGTKEQEAKGAKQAADAAATAQSQAQVELTKLQKQRDEKVLELLKPPKP